MGTLSITNRVLAYEDGDSGNNPAQRSFDWSRQIQSIPVENPSSDPFKIPPLQSVSLFDGVRVTGHAADTEYSLAFLYTGRYRLSWTGVGTAPTFRTARSVVWGADPTVTIVTQLNQSVVLTCSNGAVFGNVQAGDVVYIPGVSTGDVAGPFDSLNEGFWTVLGATSTALTIARNPGTVYSAKGEVSISVEAGDVQIFSSTGVQLDDVLRLVSGFAPALLQSFEIVAVTADALEFVSGTTLPAVDSVAPGASAVVVYSSAKQWVRLETNQNVEVTINGGQAFSVEPWLAGDPAKVGEFQLTGPVYSMSVTNKSTQTASVRIFSTE